MAAGTTKFALFIVNGRTSVAFSKKLSHIAEVRVGAAPQHGPGKVLPRTGGGLVNRSHALLITCLQFGAIASGTVVAVSPVVAVAQVDVAAVAKAIADTINGIVHANPTAPPENLAAMIVTAVRPQVAALPDDQKCQVLYQARALINPRPPAVDAALRSLEPADGCTSPTAAGPRGPGSWPGSNNPGLGGGGGGGGSHGSSS